MSWCWHGPPIRVSPPWKVHSSASCWKMLLGKRFSSSKVGWSNLGFRTVTFPGGDTYCFLSDLENTTWSGRFLFRKPCRGTCLQTWRLRHDHSAGERLRNLPEVVPVQPNRFRSSNSFTTPIQKLWLRRNGNSGSLCPFWDGEWKRNPLKKVVGDLHPTFGNQAWSRLEWSGASYVSFPWLCTGVFIFGGEGHRIVFFVQRKMTHSQNHPQGFYLPRASLWICGS